MVDSLIGSEILKIAGEVRALERAGRPVCNLTVGDFAPREFRIPAPLERAIAKALADGPDQLPALRRPPGAARGGAGVLRARARA